MISYAVFHLDLHIVDLRQLQMCIRYSSKTITIPGGTRQTIVSNGVTGVAAISPFSVALGATGPIAVEGAQYFGGSPNIGTHPGVVGAASSIATTDAFLSDLSTTLPDGTAITRKVYLLSL